MTNLSSTLEGAASGMTVVRGYNANGGYARFFDGSGILVMQVCSRRQTSTADNSTVTFPIKFDDTDDISVTTSTISINKYLGAALTGTTNFTAKIHTSAGAASTQSLAYTATWTKGAA